MTPTSNSARKTDQLLRETRLRFPELETAEFEITPIEKGGSERRFYRIRSEAEQALILVKYNLERDENRHYVEVAEFLTAHGIRAPRIYFHDPAEGLIWLEDLGETDLWSFRDEPWAVRRPLYVSALEEMTKLHSLPTSAADGIRHNLPNEFDAPLYLWEQHYFFEHCLGSYFGLEEKTRTELAALPALRAIAERLASLPRVLVHRDFQSQNVIIRDGHACLIDFQGMRPGLSKYDLASLIYDPYITLSTEERAELFEAYRSLRAAAGTPLRSDGEELFRFCAMQRLMQALGAYGFLGIVKGNRGFLEHIPAALTSLRSLVAQISDLDKLQKTLDNLPTVHLHDEKTDHA